MGIHEMFMHASDVIDINKTVVTVEIVIAKSSGAVLWGREMVLVAIFVVLSLECFRPMHCITLRLKQMSQNLSW